MDSPKFIGRRALLKYSVIALLIVFVIPALLVGFWMFVIKDWPLIIGSDAQGFDLWYLIAPGVFVVGYLLTLLVGGWAGVQIIEKGQSAYLISLASLSFVFIGMWIPIGQIDLAVISLIISTILSYFMGKEISPQARQ